MPRRQVGHGQASAAAIPSTKASTLDSIAPASPLVTHPPLASSLENALENFSTHFANFFGSRGSRMLPVAAAFAFKPRRHVVFADAALIFSA